MLESDWLVPHQLISNYKIPPKSPPPYLPQNLVKFQSITNYYADSKEANNWTRVLTWY